MDNLLIFEDGQIIKNMSFMNLWNGLFSKVKKDGYVITYLQSCLPNNSICVIPHSDGNIKKIKKNNEYSDVDWLSIQYYIDDAKNKKKVFILCVLCQIEEEKDINYLYLPLDDDLFEFGLNTFFPEEKLIKWENRSSDLCWRGGCSGIGGNKSLRVRFVEKLFDYKNSKNVRLARWWRDNKNIPTQFFDNKLHYTEFLNYKIFFIVDGNVIASNHMYAFATGCIPFMISNGKCWFTKYCIPYVHYIPIKYDLSDLIEKIEWVENNDEQAKIIAQNARDFSNIYFSTEFQKKYIKESINMFFQS